jgi:hypothetical protein
VDCSFKYAKTDSEKYQFIAPWDLEILTHEVMVCCSNVAAATGKSLRHWATMAKVINQVKSIDGVIAENFIKQDNRFSALERSMYKQFPWQTRSEFYDIVKYYKIYSDPVLSQLVHQTYQSSPLQLLALLLVLREYFIRCFSCPDPPETALRGITSGQVDSLFKRISRTPAFYQKELASSSRFGENYMYSGVIIRKYPIIGLASRLEGSQFVCPFVKRLHQRVTDGVYYDIVDNPHFSQAFGRSFERFVGDMLRRGYRRGDVLTEDEFISGKGSKRTVDWIVDDEDAALFVECKTKRMRLDGTIRMSPDSQEDDAAVLAKALCQAYKSLRDYQEGRYRSYSYCPKKQIYPVLVTLTDWYFPPELIRLVHERLCPLLKDAQIEDSLVEACPYSLISVDDLEVAIQVINDVGITAYMSCCRQRGKSAQGVNGGSIAKLFFAERAETAGFLFSSDFDSILDQARDVAAGRPQPE